MTAFTGTNDKGRAAAVLVAVLIGAAGLVLAQASFTKRAASGIDFRSTETLAWSLELDHDSPDALHDATCSRVTVDRFTCVARDESESTRTLHIRVSRDGAAWQTYDAAPIAGLGQVAHS